jgi:hypothetical protein
MTELIPAAKKIQDFIDSKGWKFCFIGGLAVQRWGEIRLTKDVDLTLITEFGDEEKFVDELLARFQSRRADGREFALRQRVLLISEGEIPLDVALGGFDFEKSAVERSSLFEYPGNVLLRTCSAEDLIVYKTFSGRSQDWNDVRSIIIRHGKELNWPYIRKWLPTLLELKGTPEAMTTLENMRKEFSSPKE